MILNQPVNKEAIAALSDEEKMQLAKQAYGEFLDILHHIGEEQRAILDKAIAELEQQKIAEIKARIQSYNN